MPQTSLRPGSLASSHVGRVKIPYYVVKNSRGYWQPTRAMREAGFEPVACGPDGPEAWQRAAECNARWKEYGAEKARPITPLMPVGSLAEAFQRYRGTAEWGTKAPRTREEWERAWVHIGRVFGDVRPRTVMLEHISGFRETVERGISRREAHRVIKIWRALWRVSAAMGYCQRDADPSLGVRNKEPERRQELWSYREAALLVKGAWRAGYRGLAAAIAVAWDSSLSPVDVRSLTPAQRARDSQGDVFMLARAKTGRAAAATITRRARRVLDAYLTRLGVEIAPDAPIFRNRSGRAYSKDTLGDDFRGVRIIVFGPGETRTLADFRRSGAVEGLRGGASAELIGNKLANDFASSANLQKTYAPVDLAAVRQADAARRRARKSK
jgi:hypothetical protein